MVQNTCVVRTAGWTLAAAWNGGCVHGGIPIWVTAEDAGGGGIWGITGGGTNIDVCTIVAGGGGAGARTTVVVLFGALLYTDCVLYKIMKKIYHSKCFQL